MKRAFKDVVLFILDEWGGLFACLIVIALLSLGIYEYPYMAFIIFDTLIIVILSIITLNDIGDKLRDWASSDE